MYVVSAKLRGKAGIDRTRMQAACGDDEGGTELPKLGGSVAEIRVVTVTQAYVVGQEWKCSLPRKYSRIHEENIVPFCIPISNPSSLTWKSSAFLTQELYALPGSAAELLDQHSASHYFHFFLSSVKDFAENTRSRMHFKSVDADDRFDQGPDRPDIVVS